MGHSLFKVFFLPVGVVVNKYLARKWAIFPNIYQRYLSPCGCCFEEVLGMSLFSKLVNLWISRRINNWHREKYYGILPEIQFPEDNRLFGYLKFVQFSLSFGFCHFITN